MWSLEVAAVSRISVRKRLLVFFSSKIAKGRRRKRKKGNCNTMTDLLANDFDSDEDKVALR